MNSYLNADEMSLSETAFALAQWGGRGASDSAHHWGNNAMIYSGSPTKCQKNSKDKSHPAATFLQAVDLLLIAWIPGQLGDEPNSSILDLD